MHLLQLTVSPIASTLSSKQQSVNQFDGSNDDNIKPLTLSSQLRQGFSHWQGVDRKNQQRNNLADTESLSL